MQTAYYSTVLNQPVETVWQLIRDFNNYPVYIEGVTESLIEDGKRGDEVGAVRRFCYGGNWLRQRLGAHSDEQRSLTYIGQRRDVLQRLFDARAGGLRHAGAGGPA